MAKEIVDSEDDGGDDDDHRADGQDVGGPLAPQSLLSALAEPPGVFIPRPVSAELIWARIDCHLGPSW